MIRQVSSLSFCAALGACLLAPSVSAVSVPTSPFSYVTTLQMDGVSGFGAALADYHGDLLIGASGSAYWYDIQTASFLQEYDHAGGSLSGGNWITPFDDKVAVGSSSGTGIVQLFDSVSGQLLQTFTGSEFGDRFGWSLASNGTRLFVGAPELRVGTNYYGQGKVFALNAAGNGNLFHNPEPGTRRFDEESFGFDVGVIGNDLYVGALHDNDGGKVWHLAADSGQTLFEYSNPHGSLGNGGRPRFGISLDVAGDYLLVGANQSSASGVNASGAAYLFDRSNGDLLHTFFDPVPGVLDNFGIDVAIVDEYVVVGAHGDGPGAAGSVIVFDIHSGEHLQTIRSPSLSPRFFGLDVLGVGPNLLAVRETTGNGQVHLYTIVPEPAAAVLWCLGVLMLYSMTLVRRCHC